MHEAYEIGQGCLPFTPEDLFQDVDAPVGEIEKRRPSGNALRDVKTVQSLLNQVAPAQGGQQGAGKAGSGLVVDGLCGPLTRAAIVAFQKRQFPGKPPDGIVDPSGKTINRLNVLAFPQVDQILLAKGRAALATAAVFIATARRRVQTVEDQIRRRVPGNLFNNATDVKLYNFHFHGDRSTNVLREIDRVKEIYRHMLTAAAHVPGGPNQKAAFGFIDFQAPGNTKPKLPFAYTTAGGFFFRQGEEGERDGVLERGDMIYLTRTLLDLRNEGIVYALIHELAHFVGGRRGDIDFIGDLATVPRENAKYARLNAFEASCNADCYAQYAFEVNTGVRMDPKRFLV